MRIGIFGGTFDPPHIGHLIVGAHARHRLELDELHYVVANDPWQKSGDRVISSAHHRLRMVELALRPFGGLVANSSELARGGESYSIDTVEYLLAGGADEVVLLLGADTAAGLDSWHRSDELREMVDIAVVARPGASEPMPDRWRISYLSVPQVDVSSTELRRRWREGEPVDVLVPSRVIEYIDNVELYPPPM